MRLGWIPCIIVWALVLKEDIVSSSTKSRPALSRTIIPPLPRRLIAKHHEFGQQPPLFSE
jgi:hypothetical protein